MMSRRGLRIATALTASALAAACAFALAPTSRAARPAPAPPAGSAGDTNGIDPYLAPQGNGGYDVSHYDVRLAYDRADHGIAAATVAVHAAATQALSQFSLDARVGLRIRSVSVDGRKAQFAHRGDKLIIRPGTVLRPDQRFIAAVRYAGDPRPVTDRSGRGKFGWLQTRHGSVTYTEPTGTSTWVPSNDVFYDKATWQVSLSAPRGLLGVSTGRFQGRTDRAGRTVTRWQQTTPIQPYIQTVAFDRFRYSQAPIAGLPAFTAVARGSGVTVGQMRSRTEHALDWLIPRLGPYPFAATGAIVVSGADSAMETAGRPTYSRGSWNTSIETVVHEQAHQWFGNTLTAARAQDIWLHEGFATYLENVETAARTGRSLADIVHEQYVWDGWGKRWRGQFGRVSLHEPTVRYLLNTTPYYRGQAALHALRTEVGDTAFWQVLRSLGSGPGGRTSTTADVIAQAERVSGRDLSAWATTWVYSVDAQRLPQAPSHEGVVGQLGPYLLDAASDWVWDPRGSVVRHMRAAQKSWQPLDQLQVTGVTTRGRGRDERYYVDFRTKIGVLYPASYETCLVFSRKDDQILMGSLMPVRFSKRFEPNRFTLRACEPRAATGRT